MIALLALSATLLVAGLVSGLARRSVLSTAVLFLVAGFVLGHHVLGVVESSAGDHTVSQLAELTLFAVLFTEGMRVGVPDLRRAWRLPGRALLAGLPLTIAAIAVLARVVVGLPWPQSFLLGAVLGPTDPVFAAALMGREEVPSRLRHLLNVESGLNDGLALPVVVLLIAALGGTSPGALALAGEQLLGIALGVAIPWGAIQLERSRFFGSSSVYETLNVIAIALLVLSVSAVTHANEFLAAFAAGITIATIAPDVRNTVRRTGDVVTELMKLAALFAFGALVSPHFLAAIPWTGYLFAVLVIVASRPLALGAALLGAGLGRKEWLATTWFGPKGFASVLYGLLVLQAGIAGGGDIFHLAVLVIVGSIVAHSSTDVAVARWFERAERQLDEAEQEP